MRYIPKGVCSQAIDIELDGDIIKHVQFTGGCHGNLQGIARLVEGMNAHDAITKIRGIRIVIAGVDDPTYMTMDEWTRQFENTFCDEYKDNYKILMSHRPEMGDVYANYDYDLVVCGHAHGGQWRIPFTGYGIASPDQGLFPKYVDGLYKLANGADMVVSRGLCRERMPYPRFFNHPELVIIDVE